MSSIERLGPGLALSRAARKGSTRRRRGRAVVIGKFDGVHLGHQLLLEQLRAEAEPRDLDFGAIFFHPDPVVVLRPGSDVRYLMTPEERVANLIELGLDFVLNWKFTRGLASLTAREFLRVLRDDLDVCLILMGPSHRIGRDHAGFSEVEALAAEVGIEVVGLRDVASYARETITSSAIRSDVQNGRLSVAAAKLSRPFFVGGVGNTLGDYLTVDGSAHIDFRHADALALPPDGVYLGCLSVERIGYFARGYMANGKMTRVEVFGLDGDLVGQEATFYMMEQLPTSTENLALRDVPSLA